MDKKTLFTLVVERDKLHPNFVRLMEEDSYLGTRKMLDDVYQEFDDPDGNFLEQFQTTGFDARYFELYLFAYFSRSGFEVNRTRNAPDFIVGRNGVKVAVEATTVNPTQGAVKKSKPIAEMSPEELERYQNEELPVKFGSPLFSKLNQSYWELEHCEGLPLVLAIEAFHIDEALNFSDASLAQYLYGKRHYGIWSNDKSLEIHSETIDTHRVGEKVIPSHFFGQPNTENISAIVFTNSGTQAKFSRQGYQHGFSTDEIEITRFGFSYNPEPDAMDPTYFSYNLSEPPFTEPWGQGLVVNHNPNAKIPLVKGFFVEALETYLENDEVKSDFPSWHPITSTTLIVHIGAGSKSAYNFPRIAIGGIPQRIFQSLCGFALSNEHPIVEEDGWFMDETESFLGVVIHDKIDKDWGYVVLARDKLFQFRSIESKSSISTRTEARLELQHTIATFARQGQRIFD